MGTTRKGAEKVGRIIDAAGILFARHGFRKTTLEEIAEKARMGKATLYHYFPRGKEQIFGAVVQHEVDTLFARIIQEMVGAGTAADRLSAYIRIRTKQYQDKLSLFGVTPEVWEELWPLAESELRRYLERELELLEQLIASGIKAGEFRNVNPALCARVLQTSMKGLTSDSPFHISQEQRIRETEEFLELMMKGLLA